MVLVLVLCGLLICVYVLLITLMLVAGFYGVFGVIVYGPFFLIQYVWRVFSGEDALEKSYDVRKQKKMMSPRGVEGAAGLRRSKKTRSVAGTARHNEAPSKPREVANGAKKTGKLPSLKKASSGNRVSSPKSIASARNSDPQGITVHSLTTYSLSDYPDMI
jgi:hypothetical protein